MDFDLIEKATGTLPAKICQHVKSVQHDHVWVSWEGIGVLVVMRKS